MAVDMFLEITGESSGKIKGESADKTHAGKIDILAWSWGVSQSGTMHFGGGGGAGKANAQDISFTGWYENSTNTLMKMCSTGEHITDAMLIVRKAGTKPLEYIEIKMKDCLVTSVSTGGSGGEDRLTANFSINFSQIEIKYVPQKADGSGDTPVNYGYSFKENVAI